MPKRVTPEGEVHPPFELRLWSKIPAKKNSYTPGTRRNAKGKLVGTFYKNRKLQTELDRIAVQLPGEFRGLRLRHPDIQAFFYTPDGRSDRDNIFQTVLDLLVEYEVLDNDSISSCNGTIVLHPAVKSTDYLTVVLVTPVAERKDW
jgi:Holliday junction resolvase RusA-like endonuclease